MNALARPEDRHALAATAAEAERSLLGAVLTYPDAPHVALSVLEPKHFCESVHQTIWNAISGLIADSRPVTPVTLAAMLGNEQVSPDLTMRQYLASIAADVHCTQNFVLETAKQVREFWGLRSILSGCEMAAASATAPAARPRDIIADLIQDMDGARAVLEGRKSASRSVGEGLTSLLDRIERQRSGEVIESCVSTCLKDLDRKLVGGFKSGELIIVAGRPGMGKSLFGMSFARQAAKAGHAGGIFSLEMTEPQVMARMVSDALYSSVNPITGAQILQNYLTEHEAEKVFLAARDMRNFPLLVDDSSALTVGEISARTRNWRSRCERAGKRLEFIVIDYLKFLRASDRYRGQRHYEVGEITAGLKALAKDLGIAIVLLVQLNREVEKTSDKRPELSHLRESGDIEADADVVLLLYREAYYLAMAADPRLTEVQNDLEIIIAKQRMGQTGSLKVFCSPGSSAVRDSFGAYL